MMKRKRNHDGSGVNEDLDDADEVGIEADEEGGESDKSDDHGEGAGHRVAEGD